MSGDLRWMPARRTGREGELHQVLLAAWITGSRKDAPWNDIAERSARFHRSGHAYVERTRPDRFVAERRSGESTIASAPSLASVGTPAEVPPIPCGYRWDRRYWTEWPSYR